MPNPITIPLLKKMLQHPDPTKLISTYYAALTADYNPRFRMAQTKWTSLNTFPTDDDWSEFSETYTSSIISSRDRIIHIKVFHHSRLTPARLHRMGLSPSAECFRGCGQQADFLDCFCSCPVVHDFWVDVGSFISSAVGLPNIIHPNNCLLGIFGELPIPSHAVA